MIHFAYRKRKWFLFFIFYIAPFFSVAQVQIDSVSVTVSSCANNGSIAVHAKNLSGGQLLFSLSGAVTEPIQTDGVFNSLPAGYYTVTVTDGVHDSATAPVTISGSYQNPDFNPVSNSPHCKGGSDGQIIGNRIAGKGTAPYSWQLVSPSPVITPPQASDTFSNLSAGDYTIKLTDACGSYRTLVVTVKDQVATNLAFQVNPSVEIVGCDSGLLTMHMMTSLFRFPLMYAFTTKNGVTTTTTPYSFHVDATNGGGGYFTVQQWLPNFSYGDYVSVTVTDSCGNIASSPIGYARPFYFCGSLSSYYVDCAYRTAAVFNLNGVGCSYAYNFTTAFNVPLKYIVVNTATSAVVDSGVVAGDPTHNWVNAQGSFSVNALPDGNYKVTATDACGNEWDNTFSVVNASPTPPKITSQGIVKEGCLDSVATLNVNTSNFPSEPVLIMLSGPSYVGSSKPGYSYHSTYTYPDTLSYTGWGGSVGAGIYNFSVTNLAAGKYIFEIIDTCGDVIQDSVTIASSQVTDLGYKVWYTRGCLGKNQVHYTIAAGSGTGFMFINDASGTTVSYKSYQVSPTSTISDSILNIPSGTYNWVYDYSQPVGTLSKKMSPSVSCAQVSGSLTIDGYQTPAITTINYIRCKNALNIVLMPDSSKGVPPYNYEIIGGPQLFAAQQSNVFPVSMPGTYLARIYDTCGNGSTAQVTVDTVSFPPLMRTMTGCNAITLSSDSSVYYSYKWTKPDGTVYAGHALTINPVTPADTGVYKVERAVDISGCKDTVHTSYHLSLLPEYPQSDTICGGGSITVGSHTYTAEGNYRDTLVSSNGCDSVIVTTLAVRTSVADTVILTICNADSAMVGTHAYKTSGTYTDTLTSHTGCDSVVVLKLTVNSCDVLGQVCGGATHVVWKDDFGSGTSVVGPPSPAINPAYAEQNYGVGPGSYSLVNYFNYHPGVWYQVPEDHTPGDAGGYFLVVDGGGASNFYSSKVTNICPYTTYTFSSWAMNMDLPAYPSSTSFIFRITDLLGNTVAQINTPIIPVQPTAPQWDHFGITFNSGNNNALILNVAFNSNGYNDFGFDDFEFATCGPAVQIDSSVSACRDSVILQATVGSGYPDAVYQWYKQDSSGSWVALSGSDTLRYIDTSPDSSNWYKLRVTDGTSGCAFVEDSIQAVAGHRASAALDVSRDTTICGGSSVTLTASGADSYQWSTGETAGSITVQPADTTVYSVAGMIGSCSISAQTITVSVNSYKRDTVVAATCEGTAYPFNGKTYTLSGIYQDTLSTATCDSIAVLNLTVNPYKRDTLVQSVCDGQRIIIGTHIYTTTGIYQDTLATASCDSIIVLNLIVNPAPEVKIVTGATEVSRDAVIQLDATPASLAYLWTSGNASFDDATVQHPLATIHDIAWVYLQGTDPVTGCKGMDSLYFTLNDGTSAPCAGVSHIEMPNAFTPNNDHLNDVFRIIGENITLKYFRIFNRWGEMVFETTDISQGWDGRYNGQITAGSYVYLISYYGCGDNEPALLKGNVVLIK